jgi:CheY-like chemotaxis protein
MTRTVIAVVEDLFFASKIRGAAAQLGVNVYFAKTADEVFKAATEQPGLIVLDLHLQRCDPIQLAQRLKADEKLRNVPLMGFFSHVRTDLLQDAERAGFDRVLPRSAFSKDLAKLLQSAMK